MNVALVVLALIAVTVFALAGAVNLDRYEAERDLDFARWKQEGGDSEFDSARQTPEQG